MSLSPPAVFLALSVTPCICQCFSPPPQTHPALAALCARAALTQLRGEVLTILGVCRWA
jgi:hypothetical protein